MLLNKNYHRKTHGDIINSNIRPQSACMMNKINSRANIIDTRLKENGINVDLQRNIIEKHPIHKRKTKNVDRTRFGYKPQKHFPKRFENQCKQINISANYSRKKRIMSAAYQNRRLNQTSKERIDFIDSKCLNNLNLTQNNLSKEPRLFSRGDLKLFNNTTNEGLKFVINLSNTSLNNTTQIDNINKLDENLTSKLMDIKSSV